MREVVDEPILQRLERNELVFALYQVLEALLEPVEVPAKGHTGIQEAIIAETLSQSYAMVISELEMPDFGHQAREAVWSSVDRLLLKRDHKPCYLEEIETGLEGSQPYLSDQLTEEIWDEILLGDGGLSDEFLWDDDWRMDSVMDLPPDAAKSVTKMTGIDLDVVQALPHAPSTAESKMAEHYVSHVIWKGEVIAERGSEGYGRD